jgi:hypothetical protein
MDLDRAVIETGSCDAGVEFPLRPDASRAVHRWHLHVHKDHVKYLSTQDCQCLQAIRDHPASGLKQSGGDYAEPDAEVSRRAWKHSPRRSRSAPLVCRRRRNAH